MAIFSLIYLIWIVGWISADSGYEEDAEVPQFEVSPANATVLVGHKHTFHCRASGYPIPTITWFKDDKKLKKRLKKRRDREKLKITSVRIKDVGEYYCVAKNKHGVIKSPKARLNINTPVEIIEFKKNLPVYYGSIVHLTCSAVGIPPPMLSWKKNNKAILDSNTEKIYTKKNLTIIAKETANYTCEAENIHIEGVSRTEKTVTVNVIHQVRSSGFCAPYNGTICKGHLGHNLVFYNSSLNNPRDDQERIVSNLWQEMIDTFDDFCRVPAEKMLCAYAFPECQSNGIPEPKPICREHCLATKEMYCFDEWLTIVNNKNKAVYFRSREHFRLPVCDLLPSVHDNHTCTTVDLFDITPDKITSKCYTGDGRYYNGSVNVTSSGIPCQAWDSQRPHSHRRTPDFLPILINSGNSCRNPGGEEERPWCYTNDPKKRWDFCDVPRCDTSTIPDPLEVKSSLHDLNDPFLLCFVIFMIMVVCILLFACIFVIYQKMHKGAPMKYKSAPQFDIDIEKLPTNACYYQQQHEPVLNPSLEKLQYPRNDIIYVQDIGRGAFGRVFQAKVASRDKDSKIHVVAVKMLREDSTEKMSKDFEREASLLIGFDHPNIVRLVGVCAIGKPMCLLFEYMNKGDLNEFLRSSSPEHLLVRRRSTSSVCDLPKLDHVEQLHIAIQIAHGMQYIAEKGYVHRDLATRNCLVSENLVVKISDFGLTRCINSNGYYVGCERDYIPVRWMPLEALLYHRFTTASDVWSYGIVLWEIFSFALQPYFGMSNDQVLGYIKEGNILTCPDNTPLEVYHVMKSCWEKNPNKRPNFCSLQKSLNSFKEALVKTHKRLSKVQ